MRGVGGSGGRRRLEKGLEREEEGERAKTGGEETRGDGRGKVGV